MSEFVMVPVPVDRVLEVYALLAPRATEEPSVNEPPLARYPRYAPFRYIGDCQICGWHTEHNEDSGNFRYAVIKHAGERHQAEAPEGLNEAKNRLIARGGGTTQLKGWTLTVTPAPSTAGPAGPPRGA